MTDIKIPDAIRPLNGYKIVKITTGKGKVTVRSLIYYTTVWRPWEVKVATCEVLDNPLLRNWIGHLNVNPKPKHSAPDLDCQCGIYTLKNPYSVLNRFKLYVPGNKDVIVINDPSALERVNEFYVMSELEVWGKVIVGDDGYRSEKARILRFFVDDRYTFLHDALEVQYGVPVQSVNAFVKASWVLDYLER